MKDERINKIRKYLIQSGNKNDIDVFNSSISVEMLDLLIKEVIALDEEDNTSYLTNKLLNSVPDAIIGVNEENEIIILNENAISLFGYTRKDLLGESLNKLIPKRYSKTHHKQTSDYLANPSLKKMSDRTHEFLGLRNSGLEFLVDISLSHLDSPKGKIALAAIRDITKQKKAENEFRASSDQFEGLFELSPDAIFIHNTKCITQVNQAFLKLFEYDNKEEIIGEPSMEAISSPDDFHLIYQAREELQKNGKCFLSSIRYLKKNGIMFFAESHASLIQIDGLPHMQITVKDISARLKSERELKKSEKKFRRIFDSIMDLFMRVNNDGIIKMISPSVTDVLGYRQEDLIGEFVGDFYANAENAAAFMETIEKDGFCKGFEASILDKEGNTKILSVNAQLYTDHSGEPLGIETVSRDITEQKRLENKLIDSHNLLEKAGRILHLGSWEWNIKTNRVSWSEEMYRIFGENVTTFEPDYEKFLTKVHPNDVERIQQIISNLLDIEGEVEFVYRIIRPSGEVRNIKGWNTMVFDGSGVPLKMIGAILDISEQVQIENKLRESKNQFESLFELSPDPIFIHDMRYITHVNQAFLKLFGYSTKKEIIGKSALEALPHPDDYKLIRQARDQAEADGTSFIPLIRYLKSDGEIFSAEIRASTIYFNNLPHAQVIVRDISERLKLETQIKKSEQKFRSVFDSMMDLFVRVDNNGVVKMVSPSVTKMFGYDQKDFVGKHASEFYKNPKDREALLAALKKDGFCKGFEALFVDKEGKDITLSINAQIFTDVLGEPLGIETISRDITSQKIIERRNTVINAIANRLSSKISIEDFCQQVFLEIQNVKLIPNMSVSSYDKVSDTVSVFFETENYKFKQKLPEIRKRGNGLSEYILRTKKGLLLTGKELFSFCQDNSLEVNNSIPTSWIGVPLISESQVEGVLVVQSFNETDVYGYSDLEFLSFIGTQIGSLVERNRHEIEIEQFEKYFSVSMDLFCIVDLSGYFKKVNQKFLEFLGCSEEELLSKSIIEFIHPDDIDKTALEMEKLSKGLKTINFTNRYYCGDGKYRWLLWTSTPDPELGLIYAAAKDITEQKEAQDIKEEFTKKLEVKVVERTLDLERSQEKLKLSLKKEQELGELKSRFVSTASHQFRTPLTVIQASIGILEYQKGEMSERLIPSFEKIHKRILEQVNRMTSLMDDVLVLGKLNDRSFEAKLNPTDIVALCSNVVTNYNDIQIDKRTTVFKIIGEPILLSLDEKLMEHAFSNLLSNAFKYSSGKAAPEVTIRFEFRIVKINIKDYGLGVPEEDSKNLFEPFYRASNALDISGTGLGTTVAKDYIELNNGKLIFNSELGKGSEFTIEFKLS
jgi:PAS domain S-box-containing protein